MDISKRLNEPSSWAGIASLLMIFGHKFGITDEVASSVVQIAAAVCSILAVVKPESRE